MDRTNEGREGRVAGHRSARSPGVLGSAVTCVACVAIGSAACQPVEVNDLFAFRPAPAIDDLTIRTIDGHAFKGGAAMIQITAPLPKGPAAVAEIALSTVDRAGLGISVALEVLPDKLFERAFTIEIGSGDGVGTVARLSPSGAEIVSSGVVKLSAKSGRISGQFRTTDTTLTSGTIDGKYEVSCLVTPEMLSAEPNGETSSGTWILVEDELKKSDFCRPFAGY